MFYGLVNDTSCGLGSLPGPRRAKTFYFPPSPKTRLSRILPDRVIRNKNKIRRLCLGPCHPLTSDIRTSEIKYERLMKNRGGNTLNEACSEDGSMHSLGIYLSALFGSVTLLTVKI